ncbi:MAG: hypothetical protein CMF66_02105 [Magnetovibrio sp.]|nr:hypothetical protein [Magnetovibrio sp.]
MGNAPKSSPRAGPLTGLRAIELGSTVAGPFCARLLADFGCDVIKVEQAEGDAIRSLGHRHKGRSLYNASIQRGKRNISINLRTDAGQILTRRLCETADIVVENFRPGTLEGWGLGFDTLSDANPGLIMVRISGFGQDGPNSKRGGYGVVCEATSGLREITGDPDRPPPRTATPLTDYIAGTYGAFGAVMAILERQRTGHGQIVDTALYESAFSFMEPHIPAFQQLGIIASRAGPRLPGSAPNSIYPTRDDGFVTITAASDAVFRRLALIMEREDMIADPQFSSAVARAENVAACDEAVAAWTLTMDAVELETQLEAAKVPAARIYNMADIFADPHYQARNMLVDVTDDVLGDVTVAGVVPKLSGTPGQVRWIGRETGADTREILSHYLQLSDEEINALIESGVIASSAALNSNDEH